MLINYGYAERSTAQQSFDEAARISETLLATVKTSKKFELWL